MTFYKVPQTGAALQDVPQWKFGTEKGKNFIDIAKAKSFAPGPGHYPPKNQWKDKPLGNMKGGARNTFISQIFKNEGNKVSPNKYNLDDYKTKKVTNLGKMGSSTRMPVTVENEWRSQ